MSELITKLNPALVVEAMQAPAIIYEKDSIEQLREGTYKSHTYDPSTKIGVIILLDSAIPFGMFSGSPVRKVQLLNITAIADKAFYNCGNLTSIIIPDSVTKMGKNVFTGCTGELTINCPMPDNSDYSFSAFMAAKFTKITIGNGVTSIGDWTFYGCGDLTSVTIPDSVTSIGDNAFYHCWNLTNVTIPDSVTSIGKNAFEGCERLTRVTIPNSVTSIGEGAFSNCRSLTSVIIPDSVTSIEDFVFWECGNLKDVVIPDSVTEIGECAFFECGLTSVTIPKHVTYISDGAFNTCSQLSTIYCKASTPPDTIEDAGCLPYNSNLKIYIPINSLELYKNHEYWQSRVDALIETVFEDEVLESGTNIKTINGESIIGSGDITIESGENVYTWSVPTDITTGTITPEEYTAIKEASQVYIEREGVSYQASKIEIQDMLCLSVVIGISDYEGNTALTGLSFEIYPDFSFKGMDFITSIPTKTSQLTNDANFVTYAEFEWDGSSDGTVTQAKFEELRNADIVIVKQQDGDIIAHACKTSGGAVIFYYSTTMDNIISSAMFIVMDHDCSWTCSTSQTTIPAAVTETTVSGWGFTKNAGTYNKPSGGIPKTDLASDVQTSLNKADTALQSYTEQYKGTVTSVKINGVTKNQSSGVVDLGYVNKQLSTSTSSSMTLSPNIYYRNTSTSLSSLTITLGSISNSNILNEYFVEFTTRSSGTTVSLPNSIKWANGVAPTFENGKTYQISIVNNLGTCVKFG